MLKSVLAVLLFASSVNSFAIGKPLTEKGEGRERLVVEISDPFLAICDNAQREAHAALALTGKRDRWTEGQAIEFIKKFMLDSTPRSQVERDAAFIQQAANGTLAKAQVVYPTEEIRNVDLLPIALTCARMLREATDPTSK